MSLGVGTSKGSTPASPGATIPGPGAQAIAAACAEPDLFSSFARMAADSLGAPMAAVAVTDGKDLRVLGRVGFDPSEALLVASFLMPRLEAGQVLVIPDMMEDESLSLRPQMAGGQPLRFVSATPLSLRDGEVFGFVAGFDTAPHGAGVSFPQERMLNGVASHLMAFVETHGRQQQARAALGWSEERFRLATRAARLGVADYHVNSGQFRWSDELRSMIGAPEDAVPDLRLALTVLRPEDRRSIRRWLDREDRKSLSRDNIHHLRIRRLDTGAQRVLEVRVWESDASGGGSGRRVLTARDVTEEKLSEEQIRWAAEHDLMTGLANRRLFSKRLSAAVHQAEAEQTCVGLLLFDLDRLKQTNDTLGHEAGDFLLRTFVERLEELRREDDTLARLGGDEFALIMPNLRDAGQMLERAQAALERMRERVVFQGHELECRASIGACVYPDHGRDAASLQRNADVALVRAKARGRNCVVVFEPEMRSELQLRLSMQTMARQALERDAIIPFYQPKFRLENGQLVGFEALLRWQHPRLGIQGPGHIAAALEETELAEAISVRMFEQVTAQMRAWLDAGHDFGHVAVNAGAAEFLRDNFAERVLAQLEAAGVPPSRLELEVTESVLLGNQADRADRILHTLSRAGVRIALDDFGTGFASLSHLKRYPVDTIKIDRSFVRDLEEDVFGSAVVRAVISLGQSLGISVVAEGIETETQADFLRSHRCDVGQGYLFGRPAEAAVQEVLLAQNRKAWGGTRIIPPMSR